MYFQGVIGERFQFQHKPAQKQYGVKLRYQQDELAAEVVDFDSKSGQIELRFLKKARAVTPGQALVLYEGNEVVGGGWIRQSVK